MQRGHRETYSRLRENLGDLFPNPIFVFLPIEKRDSFCERVEFVEDRMKESKTETERKGFLEKLVTEIRGTCTLEIGDSTGWTDVSCQE